MSKRMSHGLWTAVRFALLSFTAAVQTTANGSVRGVVTDQQGAAIPGVLVTAVSPTVPGTHNATTDASGQYRLTDLPPGDFTITGELAGFARFVRAPVTIRAGLHLTVDMVLRVGGIDERVEVRQDTPLLDTQHAGQSVNVSGELLRAIPLLERREWFGAMNDRAERDLRRMGQQ